MLRLYTKKLKLSTPKMQQYLNITSIILLFINNIQKSELKNLTKHCENAQKYQYFLDFPYP